MKRLLLALLLFSNPVLADKYTIYTTERPPFLGQEQLMPITFFIILLMLTNQNAILLRVVVL